MVQWLRLHAYTAGGVGSTSDQGTKIQYAVECGQKQNKIPELLLLLPLPFTQQFCLFLILPIVCSCNLSMILVSSTPFFGSGSDHLPAGWLQCSTTKVLVIFSGFPWLNLCNYSKATDTSSESSGDSSAGWKAGGGPLQAQLLLITHCIFLGLS